MKNLFTRDENKWHFYLFIPMAKEKVFLFIEESELL